MALKFPKASDLAWLATSLSNSLPSLVSSHTLHYYGLHRFLVRRALNSSCASNLLLTGFCRGLRRQQQQQLNYTRRNRNCSAAEC